MSMTPGATLLTQLGRPQVLVEERDRSLPGEFGCGLVITRSRVVMEAVIHVRIDERFIVHFVRFERSLVSSPSSVDAIIQAGIVNQQWRFDLRHIRSHGLGAVERSSGSKIRTKPH